MWCAGTAMVCWFVTSSIECPAAIASIPRQGPASAMSDDAGEHEQHGGEPPCCPFAGTDPGRGTRQA